MVFFGFWGSGIDVVWVVWVFDLDVEDKVLGDLFKVGMWFWCDKGLLMIGMFFCWLNFLFDEVVVGLIGWFLKFVLLLIFVLYFL